MILNVWSHVFCPKHFLCLTKLNLFSMTGPVLNYFISSNCLPHVQDGRITSALTSKYPDGFESFRYLPAIVTGGRKKLFLTGHNRITCRFIDKLLPLASFVRKKFSGKDYEQKSGTRSPDALNICMSYIKPVDILFP